MSEDRDGGIEQKENPPGPGEGDGTSADERQASGGGEGEPGLEARLKRLEAIVSSLEADELELERALALFEEGVGHVRKAEGILARTELRVEELLGDGSTGETRPFGSREE